MEKYEKIILRKKTSGWLESLQQQLLLHHFPSLQVLERAARINTGVGWPKSSRAAALARCNEGAFLEGRCTPKVLLKDLVLFIFSGVSRFFLGFLSVFVGFLVILGPKRPERGDCLDFLPGFWKANPVV